MDAPLDWCADVAWAAALSLPRGLGTPPFDEQEMSVDEPQSEVGLATQVLLMGAYPADQAAMQFDAVSGPVGPLGALP